MSQRDLTAELRAARVVAPNHVRAQVRLISAAATPPPRRFTWRRTLVIALPVAAAVAAAVIVARPSPQHQATPAVLEREQLAPAPATTRSRSGDEERCRPRGPASRPAPSATARSCRCASRPRRASRTASSVRWRSPRHSAATRVSVHASSATDAATANLTLKVPRSHVGQAIARLSALGTIIGEQVDVQDAQARLNATDRLIARLQRQIGALRAQEQTDAVKLKIAALTSRIEQLQRQQAATSARTSYATVRLQLATKPAAAPAHHGHGPLHGLGVAFRWIWIGAVYALALGGPLVLLVGLAWLAVRTIRRRRVDALLNQA